MADELTYCLKSSYLWKHVVSAPVLAIGNAKIHVDTDRKSLIYQTTFVISLNQSKNSRIKCFPTFRLTTGYLLKIGYVLFQHGKPSK